MDWENDLIKNWTLLTDVQASVAPVLSTGTKIILVPAIFIPVPELELEYMYGSWKFSFNVHM